MTCFSINDLFAGSLGIILLLFVIGMTFMAGVAAGSDKNRRTNPPLRK